jgi:hypothetical protein
MYSFLLGTIILVALMPWKRKAVDSHDKTSWNNARRYRDEAGRIEHNIQQAKDKVRAWGVYSQF